MLRNPFTSLILLSMLSLPALADEDDDLTVDAAIGGAIGGAAGGAIGAEVGGREGAVIGAGVGAAAGAAVNTRDYEDDGYDRDYGHRDRDDRDYYRYRYHDKPGGGRSHRGCKVPPGHLPPPGSCRVWFKDRPPGHQPPPGSCRELRHRVPHGACLVHGG